MFLCVAITTKPIYFKWFAVIFVVAFYPTNLVAMTTLFGFFYATHPDFLINLIIHADSLLVFVSPSLTLQTNLYSIFLSPFCPFLFSGFQLNIGFAIQYSFLFGFWSSKIFSLFFSTTQFANTKETIQHSFFLIKFRSKMDFY